MKGFKLPKNAGMIIGGLAALAIIGVVLSHSQSTTSTSYIGDASDSVTIP